MCRLAGYLGPAAPLSSLLMDPPHSLLVQSYRPRELREALVNADGVGVAWYPENGDVQPVRYRSTLPIWSDQNLAELAPRIRSNLILGAVRSATPGIGVSLANTQPFVHGRLSFFHNGYLEDFPHNFMRPIRNELSDDLYAGLEGTSDSEHLFALLLQRLGTKAELFGGAGPGVSNYRASAGDLGAGGLEEEAAPGDRKERAIALRDAVSSLWDDCLRLSRKTRKRAALVLLLSDGQSLMAFRAAAGTQAPSLYLGKETRRFPEASLLASEPLMPDSAWDPVKAGEVLFIDGGGDVARFPVV